MYSAHFRCNTLAVLQWEVTCLQTEGLLTAASCWPALGSECYNLYCPCFVLKIPYNLYPLLLWFLYWELNQCMRFHTPVKLNGEFLLLQGFSRCCQTPVVSAAVHICSSNGISLLTLLPLIHQCLWVTQRTQACWLTDWLTVEVVLVVRIGVGGQTQPLKQLRHYYVYVFLEGAPVFTKLRRAQNNYGAQRQKWREQHWQLLQTP